MAKPHEKIFHLKEYTDEEHAQEKMFGISSH